MHGDDGVTAIGETIDVPADDDLSEGKEHQSRTWTVEHWRAFFDHLAMTGDVAAAAGAIGKTVRSAFSMRRRSARFAVMWRAALDVGYDRLEAAVLRQVLGETQTTLDVGAAMLLLDRRRVATGEATESAKRKAADGKATRAAAERELLRRVRAFAKRTGTASPV